MFGLQTAGHGHRGKMSSSIAVKQFNYYSKLFGGGTRHRKEETGSAELDHLT